MKEDMISFEIPVKNASIIKVMGVGGGGSNAVNHMFRQGIKDVDFVICNTDSQALQKSPVGIKIQIGESLTEGRGAGNKPEIGRQAAIENLNDVMTTLGANTKMVFITAGMGGGTGTGAAPVIAKAVKDAGILTVAIVTLPFRFEGKKRIDQAIAGLEELSKNVDSLLVINNEKIREIHGNLGISEAFAKADDVLTYAAKGIAEIITIPGYVNVDFADVQTVMTNSGVAIMGSASAEGEERAIKAIEQAIKSPLLNNSDITGAENILLNITSGNEEVTMDEVTEITEYITSSVKKDATIIWGNGKDDSLGNKINVTIIATGFESNIIPELYVRQEEPKKVAFLNANSQGSVFEDAFKSETDKEIHKLNSQDVTQRSLVFSEDDDELEESIATEQKEGQNTKTPNTTKFKDEKEVEKLEAQPAYVRNNIKISPVKHSAKTEVSRYSLFDDEKKGVKIGKNNAYLHDNVD